jgi:simple sugar transport system permease protein
MIFTSFLVVFLSKGASQVSTDFRIPEAISDIVTGIILFFIIGCEFFLQYKIVFTKSRKENV